MRKLVTFQNVYKEYKVGDNIIKANNDLNFTINEGEFCIIVGPSGSGKTTLLNLLGGMDNVTRGKIIVDGEEISSYKDRKLTDFRRNSIGFVFQFYNLLGNLTALDNVEIASELSSDPMDAKEALKAVGLEHRMYNFPAQLSGGEQQRVSIARALAKNPKILLCDEPTGALDYKTGKQILKLLQDTCRKENMTVVIITHNSAISPMADKIIKFRNGATTDVIINKKPKDIEEIEW